MSTKAQEVIWRTSRSTGNRRLVLLALAWHHHPQTGICNPSHERIARFCRLSVRSVKRLTRQLAEDREIVKHHGAGRNHTNSYEITALRDIEDKEATKSVEAGTNSELKKVSSPASSRTQKVSSPASNGVTSDTQYKERILNTYKEDWERLPDVLDTEEFKSTWTGYLRYRKEAGLRALVASSVEHQWHRLAAIGEEAAVESIRSSIANGYAGICLTNHSTGKGGNNAAIKRGSAQSKRAYNGVNSTRGY